MSRLADVSRVRDDAGVSVEITYRSRLCEECGYDLHGLDPGHPCPECGHVTAAVVAPAPDLAWRRSVAVGLVLLLLVTLDAVASVLVQPFTYDLAGTVPAVNLPAPKVWAVPLLQRPIGRSPEEPGVVGTRTALMGLFAVWLITAPRAAGALPAGVPGGASLLRGFTRWTGVVLFGCAFGLLLASQGLWPDELPPYRLLLVACVELPATTLLYAYLRRLAETVPGQARRLALARLQWAVPAVLLAAVGMIAYRWFVPDPALSRGGPTSRGLENMLAATAFGCVVVPCGVVATAAVASLAASFSGIAFPNLWRALSGSRRLASTLWNAASAETGRLRRAGVAAGLVMLVLAAVVGNDRVMWYTTRAGLAGNLPFFNFPGPKVWAAAVLPQLGGGYYRSWSTLFSTNSLIALNLAAVWLVTLRPAAGHEGSYLRPLARWAAVGAVGAAMGIAGGWSAGTRQLDGELRSEAFAVVTVFCELPATVLLYAYLARLAASETRRAGLRAQLIAACAVVPALVGVALAAFVLSRGLRGQQLSPHVLAVCAAYGAVMVAAAAWTCVLILSLAAALVRGHVAAPARTAHDTPSERPRAPSEARGPLTV